jgi:uncharacterized protein
MRAAVLASFLALQAVAFPRPDGYVNDFAGILDESAETYLEDYLATLERDTSAEVAIATVESLDGMAIEELANRLFADWGIGQKQKDNGVLLLVAPNEREVRIEVGYGLEGVLPDGLAGDIIRNDIIPEFKANDLPKGVGRGVDRIARIVRGDPAASALMAPDDSGDGPPPLWFIIPFLGSFIFVGAFSTGLGLRTKTFGPLIFGSLFGGMPWLFAAAFPSVITVTVLLSLGIAALVLGYRKGSSAFWRDELRTKGRGSRDDDTWQMGSTSSGSSSGGSSDSGGSSSFGGGSSGGGGATGKW